MKITIQTNKCKKCDRSSYELNKNRLCPRCIKKTEFKKEERC